MFITHCLRLNLQLHTIDLVRTCRISSFCTVAWQLARFQLTRRIARSLGDSGASCLLPMGNGFIINDWLADLICWCCSFNVTVKTANIFSYKRDLHKQLWIGSACIYVVVVVTVNAEHGVVRNSLWPRLLYPVGLLISSAALSIRGRAFQQATVTVQFKMASKMAAAAMRLHWKQHPGSIFYTSVQSMLTDFQNFSLANFYGNLFWSKKMSILPQLCCYTTLWNMNV